MKTMNARTTLLVVAALAFAAMPMASADPYGDNCSDPSTYDTTTYDDVQCLTIIGPGSITHKSLLGAGLGVCSDETGSPIPCNDPGAPQSGFGAAIFDSSTWGTGDKTVTTWIEYLGDGICLPELLSACGFDVLLCNDIDYDGICTNISAQNDQLFSTQSNEALVNPGLLGLNPAYDACADKDKDDKDCPDQLDAEIGGCMHPAMQPPATGDWNYGQVVVFIGAWVDSWPGSTGFPLNVGAGVAIGHFDVWLGMNDACAPECSDGFDNDNDGLTDYPEDTGCASAADVSEVDTPGTCADGVDNPGSLPVLFDLTDPSCWNLADPACLVPGPLCYDERRNEVAFP